MIRTLMIAAALTLSACNNASVMDGMEEADATSSSIPGLGAEVQEQPQTLPSGLTLQFTRRGADQSLAQPTMDASVNVHYEGSFVEGGEVFDSSFARGEPVEFPLRAVVPGWEGNLWVKWLRRIEVGDQPWASKDEAIHYVDLMPDGTHRQ